MKPIISELHVIVFIAFPTDKNTYCMNKHFDIMNINFSAPKANENSPFLSVSVASAACAHYPWRTFEEFTEWMKGIYDLLCVQGLVWKGVRHGSYLHKQVSY